MSQRSECRQVLLQGGELGRQLGQRLEQLETLTWQRGRLLWWLCGSRGRKLLWQGGKRATVGSGQQAQLPAGHPFDACIAGMGLDGQLSLGEPAAQGFGINGQQTATVGQRNEGHGATPFVLPLTRTTSRPANSWELSQEMCRELSGEISQELSLEPSLEDADRPSSLF